MKNFSDIQRLLDRYWEGETTLEEERALKEYFNSGQVDHRLQAIAPLFQVLRQEKHLELPQAAKVVQMKPVVYSWKKMAVAASVALLLSAGAWWWSDREKIDPVANGKTAVQESPNKPEMQEGQAATLADSNDATPAAEPQTPVKKSVKKRKKTNSAPSDAETELAMEEIKAALALVSSKIRKGKQEAAKGTIHLETMDKVFKKRNEG